MITTPSLGNTSSNTATHTVTIKLRVDGEEVTAQQGNPIALTIYREFNKIPTAKIVLPDGAVERGEFDKSNSDKFIPGKVIEVQKGYQNEEETIFKGIIVKQGVKVRIGKPFMLELECKDTAVKTTLVRKSRYFYNKKDNEILREILQDYSGLEAGTLQDAGYSHKELVQYQCTDWDFVVMRAEANGMVIIADDGKINMVKPEVAAQTELKAVWGGGAGGDALIEIEADIDARSHYPSVEAKTWNYVDQELMEEKEGGISGGGGFGGALSAVSAVASAVGLSSGGGSGENNFPNALYGDKSLLLYHGGDLDTEELSAWTKGQKKRSELSRVRGRVRILGKDIRPNETISIERVAERFNGKHVISGIMHQYYSGTWTTDVQFGMSDKTFAENHASNTPAASGLLPGIQGLHIGIVSKVEGDERSGYHRIQVRIPYLAATSTNTQAEGIWARLSTLYAGADRGFVFRPEVDDEVVLGFVNGDPNDAIIVGSLHSNNNAAPVEATRDNNIKAFVAKEGMKLEFDDEKKSIKLETPDGRLVHLNDQEKKIEIKDSNSSITLDDNGIKLKSNKNIEVDATANVKIKGLKIDLN